MTMTRAIKMNKIARGQKMTRKAIHKYLPITTILSEVTIDKGTCWVCDSNDGVWFAEKGLDSVRVNDSVSVVLPWHHAESIAIATGSMMISQ